MLKKVIGILVIIAIISVGFFQKEAWLDAIKAGGMFSVLFSMLLIAADVFFPNSAVCFDCCFKWRSVRDCKWNLDYTDRLNAWYNIAVFSRQVQF